MGDQDKEEFIGAELSLLTSLMKEAQIRLNELGINEVSPDTLFKIAFSSAEGGRKHEYFDKKAAEDAKKKSYQKRDSDGGYREYPQRSRRPSY